jgi:ribosome-binding factor A
MPRSTGRPRKVADQIQRELSLAISRELRDPRVGLVTLTGVEISPDFAHATVFFTCLDASRIEPAKVGLKRAAGFLRAQLAQRIRLQTVPMLHFVYDESVERGDRLSRLIDGLSEPDQE